MGDTDDGSPSTSQTSPESSQTRSASIARFMGSPGSPRAALASAGKIDTPTRDASSATYGFTLHDRSLYKTLFGREYEDVATLYYGVGDKIAVRYVHPSLPASSAGLKAGDVVKYINGSSLDEKSAIEAMKILRKASSKKEHLTIDVEREGEGLTIEISPPEQVSPSRHESVSPVSSPEKQYEKNPPKYQTPSPQSKSADAHEPKLSEKTKKELSFLSTTDIIAHDPAQDTPQASDLPDFLRVSSKGKLEENSMKIDNSLNLSKPVLAESVEAAHSTPPYRKSHSFGSDDDNASTGSELSFTLGEGVSSDIKGWHVDSEWTEEHLKILCLISCFSESAKRNKDRETWIRKIPLNVLIYEAVISKVLDYDYAPDSAMMGGQRVFINVSQEGKDDVDDLREAGLVNGLKLTTRDYQSITAYQVSKSGRRVMRDKVTKEMKESIQKLVYVDNCQNPLEVFYEDGKFILRNSDGYARVSTVTDLEPVSYVSSAYLPREVRKGGRSRSQPSLKTKVNQITSNAYRAREASLGHNLIRDELTELITLDNVRVLVGDWIPFGSNQIAALNDRLGATERIQGGFFSSVVDDDPDATQISVSAGLTSVKVLEFDSSRYLNFETQIYYPEEEGIVQVESFGVNVRSDGTCLYGLSIESVQERVKENISLDMLSRVLVDAYQDSSKIMHNLVSSYQRRLLDMIFMGCPELRNKYVVIIGDNITPRMSAAQYMDKEANENELKQVLGDTQGAWDLNDEEMIVLGSQGMLIVGSTSTRHEVILITFLALMSRDLFLRNFFSRLFTLDEVLERVRKMIENHEKNPNSIPHIRELLSQASKDVIRLNETLIYLQESLENWILPIPGDDVGSKRLYHVLAIAPRHQELTRRTRDLFKNIEGARNELTGLREMTDVISESQMFRLQESLQANTKNLEDVFRSNERASSSLELMQVILSGTLAFEILDRITGEWSVVDTPWARAWIVEPFIEKPGIWFIVNIGLWAILGLSLIKFMNWLTDMSAGVMTIRMKVNLALDMPAFLDYLDTKPVAEEDFEVSQVATIKKVVWCEEDAGKWKGSPPKIELEYDESHSYLLKVFLQVDKKNGKADEEVLKEIFFLELKDAKVFG